MPWGRWKRLTVVGALAREGMVACMSIAAATSTAVFQAFVEQVLAPALRERPDAVVVMDNLAAHKAQAVREALAAANIDHRYLPAYSPRTSIQSSLAGPSSRPGCAPRKRAASTRSKPSSARRSPPSPPKMLEAGSASAATMLPTDPNSALGAVLAL